MELLKDINGSQVKKKKLASVLKSSNQENRPLWLLSKYNPVQVFQ